MLNYGNPAWDSEVKSFRLPPLVRLVLADVDVGSDTPSLVGKVLKWRKSNPEQGRVFFYYAVLLNHICTSPFCLDRLKPPEPRIVETLGQVDTTISPRFFELPSSIPTAQ